MKTIAKRLWRVATDRKFKQLSREYQIGRQYKRIYFIHIRKTGGTSLNRMFLSLGMEDSKVLYDKLRSNPLHRIAINGKVFVGWNVDLINRGHYFYAFSHTPLHQLEIPEHTFTITCFRDPVRRVLSHYKMLYNYQKEGRNRSLLRKEGQWLGKSFREFVDNLPKQHLLNQLYMFTPRFDPEQGAAKLREVSFCMQLENFNDGVDRLNQKTDLGLLPLHIRKTSAKYEISDSDIDYLREILEPEYTFLQYVHDLCPVIDAYPVN